MAMDIQPDRIPARIVARNGAVDTSELRRLVDQKQKSPCSAEDAFFLQVTSSILNFLESYGLL
jgi:hypothetical protein